MQKYGNSYDNGHDNLVTSWCCYLIAKIGLNHEISFETVQNAIYTITIKDTSSINWKRVRYDRYDIRHCFCTMMYTNCDWKIFSSLDSTLEWQNRWAGALCPLPYPFPPTMEGKIFTPTPAHLGMHSNLSYSTMGIYPPYIRHTCSACLRYMRFIQSQFHNNCYIK